MNLSRQFTRMVFAQVILGIVSFCIAARNPGLLLIAGAISVASWYVVEGPRSRSLPRWAVNLGALAAVLWLIADLSARRENLIVAMGHFTMVLQVLLLFSRKDNRVFGQLLVLSLLQMVAASVLSVSVFYAVLLTGYCVLALMTGVFFHLKASRDRVQAARVAAGHAAADQPAPVVGRGYRQQLRWSMGLVGVVCGAVAVVVFVVTPRAGDASVGRALSDDLRPSTTGFSQQVSLSKGRFGTGRTEPVLNLRITLDGEPVDFTGPHGWLLRGASLDQYNPLNHTWTRSYAMSANDLKLPLHLGGMWLADHEALGPMFEAEITLRGGVQTTLFSLHPLAYFQSDNVREIMFNPLDQQLSSTEPVTSAAVYRVRWPAQAPGDLTPMYRQKLVERARGLGAAAVGFWRVDQAQSYAREWNVQRQRVRNMALRILEEAGLTRNPEAHWTPQDGLVVNALSNYLRNNSTYTLSQPHVGDAGDPVIEFLFNTRSGHCEVFAAGLTALARSIGIPTRVITGYRASEYNRVGDYFVVRQSHAHAWVEAYLGAERGWRPYDATPPDEVNREHVAERTWLTSIREFYEHVEFAWIGSVLAFDPRTQASVLNSVRNSMARAMISTDSLPKQARDALARLSAPGGLEGMSLVTAALMLAAIVLAAVILVQRTVLYRRRLRALRLGGLPRQRQKTLARDLGFYLTMIDMLERHGCVRPPWQSPYGFARELAEANPMTFDPVIALTETFYEVRYGHRRLDGPRRARVRAHLRQLEQTLPRRSRS